MNPYDQIGATPQEVQAAREKLVEDHLPLVRFVVGRLGINLPSHLDRDDLLSAGMLGLVMASESYDPKKGASFKTYAYTCIRGAILDEVRRMDLLPRGQREKLRLLGQTTAVLIKELGRPPTLEDLMETLDLDRAELAELFTIARSMAIMSLDEPCAPADEAAVLRDLVKSPRAEDPSLTMERSELEALIEQAIERLPDQERDVIVLYYRDRLLLKEIGAVLGVSESRVSQIHSAAVYRLNRDVKRTLLMGG